MRRFVFCLVVVLVMSVEATASAALVWTVDGEPLAPGQKIGLTGYADGVEFDFPEGPMSCTSAFSTGTFVRRGLKRTITYTGCGIGVDSCQTAGAPAGVVRTRSLKGRLFLFDNGLVGLRVAKGVTPRFAKFTCVQNGIEAEYQIRGSFAEVLGVTVGMPSAGFPAQLNKPACQNRNVVKKVQKIVQYKATIVEKKTEQITDQQSQEPQVNQEQSSASGGGESFASCSPNVIGS